MLGKLKAWLAPRKEAGLAADLHFLRSRFSESLMSQGCEYGLILIKIDTPVPGAYLAFASRELAELALGLGCHGEPVGVDNLDKTTHTHFETPIVLFETEHQVRAWWAARGRYDYDYAARLRRYTPGTGLSSF